MAEKSVEMGSLILPDGTPHSIRFIRDSETGTYILQAGHPMTGADGKPMAIPGVSIENTSLRDINITTAVSKVDGENGKLSYRGYDIQDLVTHTSYEEVSSLLLHGELPNENQLSVFKSRLAEKAVLSTKVQKQLAGVLKAIEIDKDTNPMELMTTLMGVMGSQEQLPIKGEAARYDSSLRTMAVMPTLIGLVNARLQAGNNPGKMDNYVFPKKEDFGENGEKFSYAELLLSALQQKPIADLDAKQVEAIDKYLILHAEHGLNLSTLTARVVDSGEAKAGAWRISVGAGQSLAGDRHGNASNEALNNLKSILARPEATIEEKVNGYIAESDENYRRSKQNPPEQQTAVGCVIPGIGHKIYEAPDPRAAALQGILASSQQRSPLLDVALCLQDKLKDHPRFGKRTPKPYFPNVDFCSGVLLTELGIDERLMTSMFEVSRNAGWHAQTAESARSVGNIARPEAIVTIEDRPFIPMDARAVPTDVTEARAEQPFPQPTKLVRAA